jgi:UDP-N-acetylmuramate--alanine ligase
VRGRLIAVVEPHRYTRVKNLFREFCSCFGDADSVVVAPLYSAGEPAIDGISSIALADGIRSTGHAAVTAVESWHDIAPLLRSHARAGDTVVCLGAGTSTEWAHRFPTDLAGEPKRAGGVR